MPLRCEFLCCSFHTFLAAIFNNKLLQTSCTAGRLAMTGFFAEVVGELFTGKVCLRRCETSNTNACRVHERN